MAYSDTTEKLKFKALKRALGLKKWGTLACWSASRLCGQILRKIMEQNNMIPQTLKDAREFILEHGKGEFRPFAYYDRELDCIRVRIKDCSMVEMRMNSIFTIVTSAHSTNHAEPVGFNIKGIRCLFQRMNIPFEGVIELTEIIDGIVKISPDWVAELIKERFDQTIRTQNITVDLRAA